MGSIYFGYWQRGFLLVTLAGALGALATEATAACTPAQGAVVFKKCAACHVADGPKHGVGPSLAGVVGRRSASAPGFTFSPALRALSTSWTAGNLDQFIESPQRFATGTRMAFSGLRNAQERADLICFLATKRAVA